jgi:hypothetical protein
MSTPHKHAAVIKAWADGAEIEWRSSEFDKWKFISCPGWVTHCEYRVAPSPKVKKTGWVNIYKDPYGVLWMGYAVFDTLEAARKECGNPLDTIQITWEEDV